MWDVSRGATGVPANTPSLVSLRACYAEALEEAVDEVVRPLSQRVAVSGADEPAEVAAGEIRFGAQVDRGAILDRYSIPTR